MTKEDFTEEEFKMLKAIFDGADAVLQSLRVDNWDVDNINTLFYLKEKLGIADLV